MNKKLKDYLLKYLSGEAIIIGILLLMTSVFFGILSTLGWILIIFGAIWFIMDLTILKDV